jgi:hypothetical protein
MKFFREILFCISISLIYSFQNDMEGNSLAVPKLHNILENSDSSEYYDLYSFTNDTIVKTVYIKYVTSKKIMFLLNSKNKIAGNNCEYSGIAYMTNNNGTAQGSDELNDDELYGVYEYFTKGHPFFTIDVEFKRGKRLSIFTKDDSLINKHGCSLSIPNTLRRIKLSTKLQNNPKW